MSDRYQIDYQDSKAMWQFALESCKVADDYAEARAIYSQSLKVLKVALARAYQKQSIQRTIAEDKAYLVLANENEALRASLEQVIEQEGIYKGLEKVLEARAGVMSFNQSLIKHEPKRTDT